MIERFKPTLIFVGTFLAVYLVGNGLYGIFVESYGHRPDPATIEVSRESCIVLAMAGVDCHYQINSTKPTVNLITNDEAKLAIYEGCNGLNVMIVFAAFVAAYGRPSKRLVWFLPVGIIVIHIFNLLRIVLLYNTAINHEEYFYYFHKYFFTAALYAVVFGLWFIWVVFNNNDKSSAKSI